MDQIQTGVNPEFLQHLLTNPAATNATHRQQLETLVQTYPACSIFRLLLAKSVQHAGAKIAEKAIHSAAIHAANREVLFRLIHQPGAIFVPKPEKIYPFVSASAEKESINQDTVFSGEKLPEEKSAFAVNYPVKIIDTTGEAENQQETTFSEIDFPVENRVLEITDAAYIDPKPAEIEDEEAIINEEITNAAFIGHELEVVAAAPFTENNAAFIDHNLEEAGQEKVVATDEIPPAAITDASFTNENLEEAMAAENNFRVEDISQTFVNELDEEIVFPEAETILTSEEKLNHPKEPTDQEIDEEVYDEIMAIEDIHFEVVKEASPQINPLKNQPEEEPKSVAEPEITVEKTPLPAAQDEAEKAMLNNIASIDYFSFNHKFGQNQTPEIEKETIESIDYEMDSVSSEVDQSETATENEADTVSKYHDDKMPYTFMWWLDRTRKEYAGTYQPYTKNVQKNPVLSVGPELHQQYIESIFHAKAPLKVPENMLPPTAEPFVKRKENQLIERFIIEEPHIHPPSMDRLDTENKAKKSSEDADILVTETLAKVYLDQMLYHKALDTYKKLMLKFPEKSVYFATQITEVEKKIN
ncbi:MAG: hypothetical protein ACRYFB_02540 [Janthinobacterium lividum]